MNALAPGFVTGLSLIAAIGAQNAFVLRQGLRRQHVGLVVALCAGCDLALILMGVKGVGTLTEDYPFALEVLRWGGVAYLLWFAAGSLRSALRPKILTAAHGQDSDRRSVARTTLALTLLNPHVYLDTVVMLGSVASGYESSRWWFATGACVASIVWFSVLGFGATAASTWLGRPSVWRVIDALIAVVMVLIAWRLATS